MSRKVSAKASKLRGNPSGKKRDMVAALAGVGALWEPPSWFRAAHREKWNAVLESAPRGLLSETDRDLVVTWCVAAVAYAEAFKKMYRTGGVVINSEYGMRQNPCLTVLNKQAEYMLSLSKQLGFNPASRAALGAMASLGPAQIEGSVVSFIEQKPASLAAA